MTEKKYRFFGRRLGRKLRPGRSRLWEEALPEFAVETKGSMDLAGAFQGRYSRYNLEIGFGGGEHLAWRATQDPDQGFLGCDMFINGVASLLNAIKINNIENIRIYHGDARACLAALPDRSIARCFLLFPDPWPKYRHRKRRFVNPAEIQNLARIIEPGGELVMATDDPGYVTWMLAQLQNHPDFRWCAQKPTDWQMREWPITRYEEKAVKAGRKSTYLRYTRR